MDALQSKGRPGSTPNLRIVATISTAEQYPLSMGRNFAEFTGHL